jgi:tetratricopeptide (TPR) repeat protein
MNKGTAGQPSLSSLLARYVERQKEAQELGLAVADDGAEVVPHEVGPVQPIDARLAWDEAVAVMAFYVPAAKRAWQAPPQWPHLVNAHEPAAALAFCAGNFPQLVRNFQALTQTKNFAELRPGAGRPVHAPPLVEWASQPAAQLEFPRTILALGALRLASQFVAAEAVVSAADNHVPAQWREAWANEKAALAWQRGQCEEARAQWEKLPASVPVLFNRGMSALFCGQPAAARAALEEAVDQLPDSGAWHHLGRLYLAMLGEK